MQHLGDITRDAASFKMSNAEHLLGKVTRAKSRSCFVKRLKFAAELITEFILIAFLKESFVLHLCLASMSNLAFIALQVSFENVGIRGFRFC